jgi:peptidoglycan/xylan/chitin deacetylase (PgdA/CDA1 family)
MESIAIKRALKRSASALFPHRECQSIILAYHSVGGRSRFSQTIESFNEQMRILAGRFKVVSLSRLIDALPSESEPLAAITFDDGFADLYECAFPILRDRGLPFTVFLATGFIEQGRSFFEWSPHYAGLGPLSWDQVREMMGEGCQVGSHTHSHTRLSECDPAEILAELTLSRRILEARTGSPVNLLAYPFGQPHDYDRRVMAASAKAGYAAGFTTLQACLTSIPNPYEIPRVTIDASDTCEDFLQKLNGRRDYIACLERLNSALFRAGLRGRLLTAPGSTAGSYL